MAAERRRPEILFLLKGATKGMVLAKMPAPVGCEAHRFIMRRNIPRGISGLFRVPFGAPK